MTPIQINRLGIDIGGVIMEKVGYHADTSFFGGNYLSTPEIEAAADSIRFLAENKFHENVFLVSKCGPKTEAKTKEWLDHHSFFSRAGISKKNLYFCRERKDKEPICKTLRITCFVDDRVDVLLNLSSVKTRLHFGAKQNPQPPLIAVRDWKSVVDQLIN